MPLYAGVCETNITPPVGVWMGGYAFRPTGCVAIHDELHARAIVFHDGGVPVGIVSADLIGFSDGMVQQIRQSVWDAVGIPPEALMLNASHTHGGPNVKEFNAMGPIDEAYIDILTRKIVGAVRQAADTLKPAQLSYGRSPVQVGVNRRAAASGGGTTIGHNYAGPVAPYVDVVAVSEPSGDLFAMLFTHACHGTTLGGDNLRITADYCGYAADAVRRQTDGKATPLFLQGCSGNINPMRRATFTAAAHNGRMLGGAALQAWQDAGPLMEDEPISHAIRTVQLPLSPPPPVEECRETVARCEAQLAADRAAGSVGAILNSEGLLAYAQLELQIAEAGCPPEPAQMEIQRIAVQGACFVGLPAEVFVQYALDLDAQALGPVFTLGCTNGAHNYLPTAAAYELGGYETNHAHRYYHNLMYSPASERIVREALYDLLGVAEPDWTPYSA
jgi:neutral ceramidase